jgi:hypothetical protein
MHLRVAFKSTSVKGNLTRLYIGGWHGMGVDFMIPSFRLCLVSLHLIAYLSPLIHYSLQAYVLTGEQQARERIVVRL